MDTSKTPAEVEAVIAVIKSRMPETYQSIRAMASAIGKPAFGLVRAGIRGEANAFYAVEAGHVVGTPFVGKPGITADVALQMVQFGVGCLTMWGDVQTPAQPKEAAHGTH